MKRPQLIDGEYYHVFNRGVEKRKIFTMKRDYERFMFDLFACNDEALLENSTFYYRGSTSIIRYIMKKGKSRRPIVSILCFCLMPNHYHLLLRQHGERGIPWFMQKLGTAYTMYFNTKHERVGALFQGRYKAVHIKEESYLTHLSRYIHINPLDLLYPNWEGKRIGSPQKAQVHLEGYPWSSYRDYLGYKTYPHILDTELLREVLGKPAEIRNFTQEWVELQGLSEISPLLEL